MQTLDENIKYIFMKAILLSIGTFLAMFFGLFTIINLLIVLIFPVSWNDVVTFPFWLVVYTIGGSVLSVMTAEKVYYDNL